MFTANAETAGKPTNLVYEREGLTFAAQCFLFLDFADVDASCEPWLQRRITWHAWRHVLHGKAQVHRGLRDRVVRRAQTLLEIQKTVAPDLWDRAVRNFEGAALWV